MNRLAENKTLIKEVQREFNSFYPFLKIEFFENVNTDTKPYRTAKQIDINRPLNKVSKFPGTGRININGDRTAGQLENDFLEKYGLVVQVFRKSGNIWIETILTDNWTLDKQNKEGEFLNEQSPKSFEQRIEDKMMDYE